MDTLLVLRRSYVSFLFCCTMFFFRRNDVLDQVFCHNASYLTNDVNLFANIVSMERNGSWKLGSDICTNFPRKAFPSERTMNEFSSFEKREKFTSLMAFSNHCAT